MTPSLLIENTSSAPRTHPYPPSWFDHFKAWVERLPIPWWLFYFSLALVLVALELGIAAQAGASLNSVAAPFHIWFALEIAFVPALLHYLDRNIASTLASFRTLLDVTDAEYHTLRYRLTNLPRRATFIWSLIAASFGVVGFYFTADLFASYGMLTTPLLTGLNLFYFVLTWWLYGTLIYHSIHQLRTISQIYSQVTLINLFNLGPLYGFSGVTARTAIGLAIINLGWNTAPQTVTNPFGDGTGLALGAFTLVVFAVPLWGIHSRLVAEKGRMLGQAGTRLQTHLAELHRVLDAGQLECIAPLRDAISAIQNEQATLAKIPTWPWASDTLRAVISAVLLPILLFVIQFFVQKFLAIK